MNALQELVLWDIDGTLVDVAGRGKRAFSLAIERTWGIVDDIRDVRFAGGTDLGVLAELRARLPLHERDHPRFFDAMFAVLAEQLAESPACAYPGAAEAVRALGSRGAVQGLVTGNATKCARIKLESAGLPVDAFVVGGYGDEHADRNELAARALARAGSFDRVWLVGDTPNDINAAKHIGARAIAVATGSFNRSSLESAGADVVLDDLHALLAL